jgi:hypothetical protein
MSKKERRTFTPEVTLEMRQVCEGGDDPQGADHQAHK